MSMHIDTSKMWKSYATYELRFSDGSIYVGATRQLAIRISTHQKRLRQRTAGVKFLQTIDSGAYLKEVWWWEYDNEKPALEHETDLIAEHRARGTRLLNSTTDGKNNSKRGALMSPKARATLSKKMEKYHAAMSEEQRRARAAHAARTRDAKASPELRSEWGKKRHESIKKRLGKDGYHQHFANIGKLGVLSRDAKYTHEERSAWMRRAWETRRARQREQET